MSTYNYFGQLAALSGTVTFGLSFTTNSTSVPSTITAVSGIISYTTFSTTTNVSIIAPNGWQDNDNILTSTSKPYFNGNGLSFRDNQNGIDWNIFFDGAEDKTINSFDGQNILFNPSTESLTLACVLEGTQILTPDGYRLVQDMKVGDYVLSESDRLIKVERVLKTKVELTEENLPYKIPKGCIGATRDLFLSQGHAIKIYGQFKRPYELGFSRVNLKDMGDTSLQYYHIQLEGGNRRENTFYADGVLVESYDEKYIE